MVPYPLSVDQTTYRKDERQRVKACGAHVMTMAMANGEEDYDEGWEEKRSDTEVDDMEYREICSSNTISKSGG